MADDVRTMSWTTPDGLGHYGGAMLRLLALLNFALILGACTKCDVPTWPPASAAAVPLSCHSDAPAR
jgi:hypothetical protein